MTTVIDRATGEPYDEPPYAAGALRRLYGSRPGRLLLPAATHPWASELAALTRRTRWSRRAIDRICETYGVDLADFDVPEDGFASFADFFVRDWAPDARPLPDDPDAFCSPADGTLLLVPLDGRRLVVKGVTYEVGDLLGESTLAWRFTGGTAVVVRLGVHDTHRFCFPAAGRLVRGASRRGRLHPTGPDGDAPFLVSNARSWDLLTTDRFGDIVQAEVGAMLAGRIVNHRPATFERGDEKGRFELGGSTVVLLLPRGAVAFDADLAEWSGQGVEVRVQARERLGVAR